MYSLGYSGCTTVYQLRFSTGWKMQSDIWGTVNASGFHTLPVVILLKVQIRLMVGYVISMGSSQVIQSYGSALSAYGLIFLGAHFIWAFSLMFLFSGRGYWQVNQLFGRTTS
jgi:photosystem I P700 chlorophyll a apoprotein A1